MTLPAGRIAFLALAAISQSASPLRGCGQLTRSAALQGCPCDRDAGLKACATRGRALISSQGLSAAQSAVPQARVPAVDIGFEPTPIGVADRMLELAGVNAGDVVYDLGSGDGRIVIRAAQKYGARGVGVEIQPALVEAARKAAAEAGVADKVTFVQADLFEADISAATVVTLYLWPSVNERLEPRLRRELRPGTRIVSHAFGSESW